MTHLQKTVNRWLVLLGCCATWATFGVDVHAQRINSAASSMQNWRRHSQGLSSSAALARYRIESLNQRVQQAKVRRHPAGFLGSTIYSTPYYAITTHRTIPVPSTSYYPTTGVTPFETQAEKPFADVRHRPNAVQRYWPYMLEAREDPTTGLVIWRLP